MHTIEVEDEIYQHLLQSAVRIGESASEILRRLLRIPTHGSSGSRSGTTPAGGSNTNGGTPAVPVEVSDFLSDPRFLMERDVVGRFLLILSSLYRRSTKEFEKVLTLAGRRRKYVGRSSEELEQHGNSVFPKQIPGSPYWVVTNNDTQKKCEIVRDAMKLLTYSDAAVDATMKALGPISPRTPKAAKAPATSRTIDVSEFE